MSIEKLNRLLDTGSPDNSSGLANGSRIFTIGEDFLQKWWVPRIIPIFNYIWRVKKDKCAMCHFRCIIICISTSVLYDNSTLVPANRSCILHIPISVRTCLQFFIDWWDCAKITSFIIINGLDKSHKGLLDDLDATLVSEVYISRPSSYLFILFYK